MIAGIILAAGASSRMGTPKALLDFRGETFLGRLIRVLSGACDPVIVALGYHADQIRATVSPGNAQFVTNPDPSRGQLSSLQTALAAIPSDSEGFLFQPVDCPAPEPETVRRIVDALHSSGALLVIPRYEGQRGHPVAARRELIPEFLALPPEAQAKDVVHRHVDRTHYLDVDDPGILSDIDDPEAYRVLREGRTKVRLQAEEAAEKLLESPDWQAETPAPPKRSKQLRRGGTGGFACRTTLSAGEEPA